jgi:hypothetical protein
MREWEKEEQEYNKREYKKEEEKKDTMCGLKEDKASLAQQTESRARQNDRAQRRNTYPTHL